MRVARQVRRMMQAVVSAEGTAPQAAVPGCSVAGKTGTAYKWTSKGYDRTQSCVLRRYNSAQAAEGDHCCFD
ncbi:penicillin-binding transpeptidase domain-containing protein [Paraburkholderia fungorum]|uniref:penicillin-binding transpeptidase domain-containing protein n=1 Tax=Paraburkholderia fungorum TaxID=134537 RepID=UPI00351E5161